MLASILFALVPLVSAIITPTTPDGSTVINEGSSIDAAWTADDTGAWTNVTIQLMTGDNLNMIPLRTLATGVDGTTTTTFSTPVPDVEPNSKIYFLQFTNGGDPAATWTTRFTIASADGTTTEPENTTNYNGEDVQWGVGAIVGDATSNSTTPSSGAGGAVSGASASASAIASAASSAGSGITNYGPSSSTSTLANPSNGSGPSRASNAASNAGASASSASSGVAASASTSPNSAAGLKVVSGGFVGLAGLVMGLVL